jgi:hypothetical protein
MSLLATIFVSGIGAAIGSFFQRRTWDHQQQVTQNEAERKAASTLYENLSSDMDKRLYTMRLVFWGIDSKRVTEEQVNQRWKNYRQILEEWNYTLNRKLSMAERYFGKTIGKTFEFEIQKDFRELHSILSAYYYQTDKRDSFEKEKFSQTADRLSALIRQVNLDMLKAIQTFQVGIFHPDVGQ